jgi:hypothetical protein
MLFLSYLVSIGSANKSRVIHGCLRASVAEYLCDYSLVKSLSIRCLAYGDIYDGKIISRNSYIFFRTSSLVSSLVTNGCFPVNKTKAIIPAAQISAP